MTPSPDQGGIQVKGLPEFRAELKKAEGSWEKELDKAHRKIAKMAAEGAQGIAIGMGGIWGRAASGIKGKGGPKGASIGSGGGIGNVAFWGAKRHTGWYAKPQYNASAGRQHPPWVGTSWETGAASGGPYAINRAIFFDLPLIERAYWQMVDEVTRGAFNSK